jgi:hypothetical protein
VSSVLSARVGEERGLLAPASEHARSNMSDSIQRKGLVAAEIDFL